MRLNITMDQAVYQRLKKQVRPKKMSTFITEAVKAKLRTDPRSLDAAYKAARRERWRKDVARDWSPTELEGWPG